MTERARPGDATLAADAMPELGLAALRRLRGSLDGWERDQVAAARAQGWRWSEIARVLGRSRQAVQQRYARSNEAGGPASGAGPRDEALTAWEAARARERLFVARIERRIDGDEFVSALEEIDRREDFGMVGAQRQSRSR